MAEHATVIDVSRYYPAAGKRDELLAAMKKVAAHAAESKGCFGAQACGSDQDGDAVIAISRWESQSSLEAFAKSPDFVRERERMTALLAKPTHREHFRPE
jgi:heme-degrading monooxygenase HmoA